MRSPLATPRAVAAVMLLFAYNGVVIGVYASSIAILKDKLGLDAIKLAILFVLTGVAAVTAMQVCGRLADRYGARRVCLVMIVPLMVAALGYGSAPSYAWLLVAGVFLGAGNGGVDVAMNALAVQVERHRLAGGRGAIMSFFHGLWSVGSLVGSFAVSMVGTAIGLAPQRTLWVVAWSAAGLGLVAILVGRIIVPETERVEHATADGKKTALPRAVYLMGIMAIAFGLGEGTASDWSGTHVQTVAAVDPRVAAWPVTAMMACMTAIRLTGDRLVARLGRRTLVRLGGAVAAAGYLLAGLASGFPVLLVAWSLVGMGIGVVAPQVYASAGHLAGGRGVAVAASFGYTTFLAGPALIGGLVHSIGIQHTMLVPGLLLLGLIPLAGVAIRDSRHGDGSAVSGI
jgi:MFS family permease